MITKEFIYLIPLSKETRDKNNVIKLPILVISLLIVLAGSGCQNQAVYRSVPHVMLKPVLSAPRHTQATGDAGEAEAWAFDIASVDEILGVGESLSTGIFQASPLEQCRQGSRYIDEGELRRGINIKAIALYRSRESGDYMLAAECARGIARAYSYISDFVSAVVWADESESYLTFVDPIRNKERIKSVRAASFKVKGDSARTSGDIATAIGLYQDGLSLNPSEVYQRSLRLGLAQALIQARRFSEADTLLSKLERSEKEERMKTWIWRMQGSLALARQDHATALHIFSKLKMEASSLDHYYLSAWATRGMGRSYVGLEDINNAIRAYDEAITSAERVRGYFATQEFRVGVFGNLQEIYDEFVDLLMKANQPAKAFEVSEKSRTRAHFDTILSKVKYNSSTEPFNRALERTLLFDDIRKSISDATVLIVYHVLEDKTVIWSLRNSGIHGHIVNIGRDDLKEAVRGIRRSITNLRRGQSITNLRRGQSITNLRRGQIEEQSKALYDALIASAVRKGDQRLVVVPHDSLHYLPFATLRKDGRWLIEKYSLSFSPSASIYVLLSGAKLEPAAKVLALGNPELGDEKLALPGAEAEARGIAETFPNSEIFLRDQATKSVFFDRAEGNQLIHIGAHAYVDPVDPLSSMVWLANGRGGTDMLEAREFYAIDLTNVGLFVLSACKTGMGRLARGDEFLGFKRAVIGSGSAMAIVALWPVADDGTAEFFKHFYKGLIGRTPVEALRVASQALIESGVFADPFYWAAFILHGGHTRVPTRSVLLLSR